MWYYKVGEKVEAYKWDGDIFAPEWVLGAIMTGEIFKEGDLVYVKTPAGKMNVYKGDYLVKQGRGFTVIGNTQFNREYMRAEQLSATNVTFDRLSYEDKVKHINNLIKKFSKEYPGVSIPA